MTTDKRTDARKLVHATLEAMRFRAIEATKAGMKATDLALAYGVHRRTVFRWLADFYKGGVCTPECDNSFQNLSNRPLKNALLLPAWSPPTLFFVALTR